MWLIIGLWNLFSGGIIPATRVISSQVGTQRGIINYTNILQDSTINISLGIQVENFTDPSYVFWQFSTPWVTDDILYFWLILKVCVNDLISLSLHYIHVLVMF